MTRADRLRGYYDRKRETMGVRARRAYQEDGCARCWPTPGGGRPACGAGMEAAGLRPAAVRTLGDLARLPVDEEGGHAGPPAGGSAVRRLRGVACHGPKSAGCSCRRGRSTSRSRGGDWSPWRAETAAYAGGFRPGDVVDQHVPLPPDAGGPPLRPRAGPARLHRRPDRSRERRGAGQDDPRSRRHGLRRHAVVPAGDPQACRREGARAPAAPGRPGRRRGPAALAPAGHRGRPRDPDAPGLRHGGPRDHRLRVPGGRRDARHGGRRPRDLRSRDRRAAARGRDGRDRLHRQPPRLSDDPLRHRRPLGRHRGAVPLRAHLAAHAGLARAAWTR